MSMGTELLAVEDARARTLALASPLPMEWARLDEALGRALAADLQAQRTLPPWDNSAMDGYAVRAADLTGPLPIRLTVGEIIHAGQTPRVELRPGTCARIMTGAPLPVGADAVVMQERTRQVPETEGPAAVEILEAVSSRNFVRPRGEDARQGELLLGKGTPLGIPELGLITGQGLFSVPVPRRPRVAILSTGDELCRGDEPSEGRIIDTNAPTLALAVARAGGVPTLLGIARDTLEEVSARLADARDFDLVLTSAGVSVGDKDFVKAALTQQGVAMDFWRVAIKPGKPLAVGRRGHTLYMGLPGNPTSSLVTFELFVRPVIRRLLGLTDVEPPRVAGRLEGELRKPTGLAHYVRTQATWREGELWVRPLASQTSGALRSASSASHLLHFPRQATSLAHGAHVELLPVSWTV
ncbi:gephyrin-like molybdotransferase Glp [Stigmatella aurantiaca]